MCVFVQSLHVYIRSKFVRLYVCMCMQVCIYIYMYV